MNRAKAATLLPKQRFASKGVTGGQRGTPLVVPHIDFSTPTGNPLAGIPKGYGLTSLRTKRQAETCDITTPADAATCDVLAFRCNSCYDEGHVCEEHPDTPWEGIWGAAEGHPEHGGIGMPCLNCCTPLPADGTTSITLSFVPDWKRP